MKRCPQCEFIYEDDQSLCDMDGVLLVLDSRILPNHQALATLPAKPQPRRNRAVPAFATLILLLVLGMVVYVSTQRKPTQTITETPASAAGTSNPVPEVIPLLRRSRHQRPFRFHPQKNRSRRRPNNPQPHLSKKRR